MWRTLYYLEIKNACQLSQLKLAGEGSVRFLVSILDRAAPAPFERHDFIDLRVRRVAKRHLREVRDLADLAGDSRGLLLVLVLAAPCNRRPAVGSGLHALEHHPRLRRVALTGALLPGAARCVGNRVCLIYAFGQYWGVERDFLAR